ncbi:hypothetical protein PRNP1_006834 [Phytophthora ramorum]
MRRSRTWPPAAEDVLDELYAVMLSGLGQSGSSPAGTRARVVVQPRHVGIHPPPQEGLQQPVEVLLQLRVREQNTCCTYLVEVQDRQISILKKSNSVGLSIKYVPILPGEASGRHQDHADHDEPTCRDELKKMRRQDKLTAVRTQTVCGLKKLQGPTEDEEVTRELRKLLKSDPVQRRPESDADELDRDQEGDVVVGFSFHADDLSHEVLSNADVTNIKQELEDVVYELGVNLDTVKDTQACMKVIPFLRRPLRECPPAAVDKHVQVVAAVLALQA